MNRQQKDWMQCYDPKRRMYNDGLQCELLGARVPDMSREQLIVFIGYLNDVVAYERRNRKEKSEVTT